MQIGIIGIGKMGYNLALNMHKILFNVIAYDIAEATRKRLAEEKVTTVDSLETMAAAPFRGNAES